MLTCSCRMRCSNRSSGPSNSPSRIFKSSVVSSVTMCGTAPATLSGARSSTISGLLSSTKSVIRGLPQPGPLENLLQSHARNLLCLFTALVKDRIKLLVADLSDTLLDRPQKLDRRFSKIAFQLRVPFAREVLFDFLHGPSGHQVIDLEQIVDCGPRFVKTDLGSRVSHGAFELLLHGVGVVHQQHTAVRIVV